MASVILKNARILMDGYDISGSFNQIELALSAEMLDATVFTTSTGSDVSRKYKAGLKTARLTGRGFWDSTADAILFDRVAVNDTVISVYPDGIIEGSTSTGSGFAFKAALAEYAPQGRIGDLLAFTVTAEGRGID